MLVTGVARGVTGSRSRAERSAKGGHGTVERFGPTAINRYLGVGCVEAYRTSLGDGAIDNETDQPALLRNTILADSSSGDNSAQRRAVDKERRLT